MVMSVVAEDKPSQRRQCQTQPALRQSSDMIIAHDAATAAVTLQARDFVETVARQAVREYLSW